MPRGPLPNPQSRRRNAPTIATTSLPSAGRAGRPPTVPRSYKLGPAGRAFWRWAWKLPQATQWDAGSVYAVARRAQLEDELAAMTAVDGRLDIVDICGLEAETAAAADEVLERVEWIIRALKGMASGSTTVMREQRELDNRLGLNPKALADLRWTIEQPPQDDADADDGVTQIAEYRERLG